ARWSASSSSVRATSRRSPTRSCARPRPTPSAARSSTSPDPPSLWATLRAVEHRDAPGHAAPVESDGLAYKWVVMINTTIGILMAAMDSSIVTVALPQIARQLDASVAETMWVVMGFQLVITALLMPFARLADMKGRVGPY